MKQRQVTGPKSSFVCATASALALFGAYESISISSSSRPIKATTTGMNVGNQATWALFTGSYSFGLLDLLLLCFSGNFCLSVWLACVYYCSVDAPCGCCSSSGTLIWLLVVALCLKLWVIGVRSCWLNVLLSLASKLYEVGGACCFSVPSFASSFHLSILSMSMQHSFGRGLCFPSLQTVKSSKSVLTHSSKSYPIREYLPPPISFGWALSEILGISGFRFKCALLDFCGSARGTYFYGDMKFPSGCPTTMCCNYGYYIFGEAARLDLLQFVVPY